MLKNKIITLIITGGIAAYKSCDLIRRLKSLGAEINVILTKGGEHFVTAVTLEALSGRPVFQDLWALDDQGEMSHIQLSRKVDLILVAPATAHFMAKTALGLADDLASTILLAANKPIMMAPAMNPQMWAHPATQSHLEQFYALGIKIIEPDIGEMACGEVGAGRMAEIDRIVEDVIGELTTTQSLKGVKALVTAGPTQEPLDPIRYISNHSSGKQGYAIAQALINAGCEVTLISGPTALRPPHGVHFISVQTADEMLAECLAHLPTDIAICTAAVADWKIKNAGTHKLKKAEHQTLDLVPNPDILKTLGEHKKRPKLLIGFAAETRDIIDLARQKRVAKKCDFIVANQIDEANPAFGLDENDVHWIGETVHEHWPLQSKMHIAQKLVEKISEILQKYT